MTKWYQKVDEVYGQYINFESRMCCLYMLAYVYTFSQNFENFRILLF